MDSLEKLIAQRDDVREKLEIFRHDKIIEERKWTKTVVDELGHEKSVIDYFAWRKHDNESYEKYANTSEYFILEVIRWLEEQIDEATHKMI